jgi:hypothetical protein
MPIHSNASSLPPEPMSPAVTQLVADLQATICRLEKRIEDNAAADVATQRLEKPEDMISLWAALAAVPGVDYQWVVKRLRTGEIVGEKRGLRRGRWFVKLSSLQKVKRATYG